MAVERHLAQLHAACVRSWRSCYRESGVEISIAQTKCISKWNVQSFQRNGELRLQDIAVDANRGRTTRFSIGRDQRVDVCGAQLHSGLLMSAPLVSSYPCVHEPRRFFRLPWPPLLHQGGGAGFVGRSSFRDRCGFIGKIDVP